MCNTEGPNALCIRDRDVTIVAAIPGSVILDAQGSATSNRRVMSIFGVASVHVIGLNFTGGYSFGSHTDWGGGISVKQGAQLHLKDSVISQCQAKWGGGLAIHGTNAAAYLYSSEISSCTGTAAGGGIWIENSNTLLSIPAASKIVRPRMEEV